MKTRTKLGALALSVALASTLCVPLAFAEDPPTPPADPADPGYTTTTAPTKADGTGTADSTMTGTIKATTLSVSVPTTVAFNIDPGAYDAAKIGEAADGTTHKSGQFTNPTSLAITNNSVVDVYCYVTGVTLTQDKIKTLTLVNAPGNLTRSGSGTVDGTAAIMFGLSNSATVLSGTTPADWLMSTVSASAPYYALNKTDKGKLSARLASTDSGYTTQTNHKAEITIRGAVKDRGWTNGDSFKVVPQFTIATTAPTA